MPKNLHPQDVSRVALLAILALVRHVVLVDSPLLSHHRKRTVGTKRLASWMSPLGLTTLLAPTNLPAPSQLTLSPILHLCPSDVWFQK